MKRWIPATALCALLSLSAMAQQSSPPPMPPASGAAGRHHHGPPPEALQACSGKAAGTACSFTGRQGEKLSGTCSTPPALPNASASDTPPVACRPANMPAEGPPPAR